MTCDLPAACMHRHDTMHRSLITRLGNVQACCFCACSHVDNVLMSLLLQDSLRSTQSQLSEAREAFEVTAADNHVMAAKLAEVWFVALARHSPTLCSEA